MLVDALEQLAMPAHEQLRLLGEKLDGRGLPVDELALQLDDIAGTRRALVSNGAMTEAQAEAVGAVHEYLGRLTVAGPVRWTPQAVATGDDWAEVRRLSSRALVLLAEASR